MSAIDSQLVYVVDRDNDAAWFVARKICESKQPAQPQYRPATPAELREQRRKAFDKRVEAEKRGRKR